MNLGGFLTIIVSFIMMSTLKESYGFSSEQVVITGRKGNYQTALDHCKSIGMRLIHVENEDENSRATALAIAKGIGRFWVDGNDIKVEGTWVNSNNELLTYKKWHGGEPNNWGGHENCAEVFYFGNSDWNDINCDTQEGIICLNYHRKHSHSLRSDEIYITGKRGNFQAAQDHCRSIGKQLIRIETEEENTLVCSLAIAKGIGRYWVDGNDIKKEGTWLNLDNELLTYKKWHGGEPNNWFWNENCAEVFYFGNSDWNDINCNTQDGIICYTAPGYGDVTTTTYQFMVLSDKVTYNEAVHNCKAEQMALVQTDSAEINKMVFDFADKHKTGSYWMDLNDKDSEGTWVHDDGRHTTYRNFAPGEPNGGRGENCVHGLYYQNALWNDISCSGKNTVICFKIV